MSIGNKLFYLKKLFSVAQNNIFDCQNDKHPMQIEGHLHKPRVLSPIRFLGKERSGLSALGLRR